MNIVFMGTPSFALPILDMLYQEHHVMLVVTQPDKVVGRKKVITPSPIKERAQALNLEVFQPAELKKDYQKIIDLNPDLIVTAAYGQMLPKALLDHITAINVHGSLLPQYRGGAPIQYALFDGLKQTGVTIMFMAYAMDSGDIIKQEALDIAPDDDYQSLSQKLSHLGSRLLSDVLGSYPHVTRIKQNGEEATYAYTLKYEDEIISFSMTSEKLINKIRGLSPEPGATLLHQKSTIKVYGAKKSDIIDSKAVPGMILSAKKKLIIQAKDGAIEITKLQLPGKRIMMANDFLNGQNIFAEGDVLIEGSLK